MTAAMNISTVRKQFTSYNEIHKNELHSKPLKHDLSPEVITQFMSERGSNLLSLLYCES